MTAGQDERTRRFADLHGGGRAFVIANAWDAGSARLLANLGFSALATSSAASAYTLGKLDGEVTREEAIAGARAIVEATSLPVSADLENGFGDSPEEAAETIRLAAEAGLAGASIEDAPRDGSAPYPLEHAVARIEAAVRAARALPVPFVLTARVENFVRGNADLPDTLRRLRAFAAAGADVLFAPGLPDLAAVRDVVAAVEKPVNFMVGIRGRSFSVAELEAAGVRRISLATSLYRAAMSGLLEAAQEVRTTGTFGYLERGIHGKDLERWLRR
ncbi:MAG: isocitrate lyase/phosphoenolpyruvate mutase family protein [Acidobacteriota bacterium]